MPDPVPEFWTAAELARYLHVDRKTVGRWCNTNRIPGAVHTPGGHWRIPTTFLNQLTTDHATNGSNT